MTMFLSNRVGWFVTVGLFTGCFALAPQARADLIFSGTGTAQDGNAISASVDFSLTGNIFQIVLTNTHQTYEQGDVLTNLQVSTAPAPATALPSASGVIALTAGSSYVGQAPAAGIVLGQEWAYFAGSAGGVASSGFGVGSGDGNLCGATNASLCTDPHSKQPLDGADYGLVGPGTTSTGNNGLKYSSNTYINDSITVDITLAANSTFTLADITSVQFRYGTGNNEGEINVDRCTSGSNCSQLGPR